MSAKEDVNRFVPESHELDTIREQVKAISELDPDQTIFYLILDALDSESREAFASDCAVSVYQWYGTSENAEKEEDMDCSKKIDARYRVCCQLYDLVQKSLKA